MPVLLDGKPFTSLVDLQYETVTNHQLPGDAFIDRLRGLLRMGAAEVPPNKRLTGQHLAQLSQTRCYSVAFSPNGEFIAAVGAGSPHGRPSGAEVVALWDATSRQFVREFGGGSVIAWSPDSRRLVVGGARIWTTIIDVVTGEEEPLSFFAGSGIARSPDGRQIAYAPQASHGVLIDGAEGPPTLPDSAVTAGTPTELEAATCVAWSPEGSRLAAVYAAARPHRRGKLRELVARRHGAGQRRRGRRADLADQLPRSTSDVTVRIGRQLFWQHAFPLLPSIAWRS